MAVSRPLPLRLSRVSEKLNLLSIELRRLYADLMTRYVAEHAQNRDAFYQHLCALDFL